jgi:flagellar basal-body rod protein FlgB
LDFCFGEGVVFLIENILFNKTLDLLKKGLDAASLRNGVIANNLANVDTPGFKRSEVVFEEEMRKALAQKGRLTGFVTNPRHIPIGGPAGLEVKSEVVLKSDTAMRNDGNNVDIDREMAALAKNTLIYTALVQEFNSELQKIRTAIYEGRK